MKRLLPHLMLLLVGCVAAPTFRESPEGYITATLGINFLADQNPYIATYKSKNGNEMTMISEGSDATSVANTGLAMWGLAKSAAASASATKHAATVDKDKTLGLGAQEVQKKEIDAGVTTATTLNPNVIPK